MDLEKSIVTKIVTELKKDLDGTKEFTSLNYFQSYFDFIKYFKDNPVNDHTFIIGSHFVYGWMPTILDIYNYSKDIIKILECAKSSDDKLTQDDYAKLAGCINNSMVGASKLLHFINPSIYPIIDSNITSYLKNNLNINVSGTTIKKKAERYMGYKSICSNVITGNGFNELYYKAIEMLYNVKGLDRENVESLEKMRVLEFLFFEFGKKQKKKTVRLK